MRLYTLCNCCGKRIYLKGNFSTAEEVRSQMGEIMTVGCRHCHRRSHLPYTYVWARSWGPWRTVALLSAFVLGATAIVALLQMAGSDLITVIWLPFAALTAYALMAKHESDTVELFNRSLQTAPPPRLTHEAAVDFSDPELIDWFDVEHPNNITSEYEQVLYYASVLNHEESPRYFEWFYYYEAYEHNTPDDGTLLYNSLLAVGASRHAAIAKEAREIYLGHKDDIDMCLHRAKEDGYQQLLAMNLFEQQDDATLQALYSEPLVPLMAQYIRDNLENLER